MQRFTVPTPDSVREALSLPRNTEDHFQLFDSPGELADYGQANALEHLVAQENRGPRGCWSGGLSTADACRTAREGDLSAVAASDALLSKFERFAFETGRKAWLDDVTGAIPNVPAFIAGHPLAMRRRVRQDSASAPLAIIVDVTTSSRVSARDIQRRGAAILALVRILSTRRPIELWAGTMLDADNRRSAVHTFARIETSPLDLATACFALVHPAFSRHLCYGLACLHGFAGGWPYGAHARHRPHMAAILAPAFTHATQTLCLPPLHAADQSCTNPEAWLEQRLAELSPVDLAA